MRIVTVILISLMMEASLAAGKPVIGIVGISTSAQNISCDGWDRTVGSDCNEALSEGFRAMLETAITKTGKMSVMERVHMDKVLQEQGLGQAGFTDSGRKIGGLVGVDYLIYGTVTKFGSKATTFSVGTDEGVGSLLGSKARQGLGSGVEAQNLISAMAVDLKVTDVSTGTIIIADNVEGEVQQGSAFSVGGIQSGELSADPYADVQRVVAARISEAIVTSRIPIKVIKVQQDGTLILNYGNVFFSPGDQLVLFEVGETFTDPDTGEVLGAEEKELGRVEITHVEQKFSKARTLGEAFNVASGSVLKRPAVIQHSKTMPNKLPKVSW